MKVLLTVYFIILQIVIFIFNKNFIFSEILIFSLILWINYIVFKISNFNIKSPIFLFAMIFNICNVVHVYYLANILNFDILYTSTLGYTFSRETFTISLLLNLAGIFSVFIGILIGIERNKMKKYNSKKIDVILQNSNIFLIIGFLFFLVYIYSYGGFWQFYSNLYYIRGGIAENKHAVMQMIGNLRYVFYLGLFIEIYKLKNYQQSKNMLQIFGLILIAFLIALSSGGRFTIAFLFFQLFLLTYNPKRLKISNIIFLGIFVLIIIIFFPIKWSFFRFLAGDYVFDELVQIYVQNYVGIAKDLIGNHMGSYSAFIVLLDHGRIFMSDLFFKPIANLASIIIPRRFLIDTIFEYRNVFGYYNEIISPERFLLGEFHFNFLGYFYIILGYSGIIILSILWGMFLGFLEKKYIINENKNYILYLYLYSSFVFMIAMNGSFDPYLRSLAYNFIGLLVCFCIIFIKNNFLKRKIKIST